MGVLLGCLWAVLGHPGDVLGHSWDTLGLLGGSFGHLWGVLGSLWGGPWGILGDLWDVSRSISPNFRPTPRKYCTCRAEQPSAQTCDYIEREARFLGCRWALQDCVGFLKFPSDSLGFLWILAGSLGCRELPRTHWATRTPWAPRKLLERAWELRGVLFGCPWGSWGILWASSVGL